MKKEKKRLKRTNEGIEYHLISNVSGHLGCAAPNLFMASLFDFNIHVSNLPSQLRDPCLHIRGQMY